MSKEVRYVIYGRECNDGAYCNGDKYTSVKAEAVAVAEDLVYKQHMFVRCSIKEVVE